MAAAATGIDVERERLIAFVLSAVIVAMGGVLFAHFLGTMTANTFFLDLTFVTLTMLVVGGMRSLTGACAGVAFVSVVSELFRSIERGIEVGGHIIEAPPGLQEIALAVILLAILIMRPHGLVGRLGAGLAGAGKRKRERRMFVACIDIGGTFTDLVLYSREADLEIFKSPTTPGEFEHGFINVLRVAADSHKLTLGDFLAQTDLIVHGTTVSTNALVEGKVAPAGLICNAGHPDILTLRESPRKRAFNTKIDFPPPYIPRNRTCEVRGRIDAMGNEIEQLNEKDVRRRPRNT